MQWVQLPKYVLSLHKHLKDKNNCTDVQEHRRLDFDSEGYAVQQLPSSQWHHGTARSVEDVNFFFSVYRPRLASMRLLQTKTTSLHCYLLSLTVQKPPHMPVHKSFTSSGISLDKQRCRLSQGPWTQILSYIFISQHSELQQLPLNK